MLLATDLDDKMEAALGYAISIARHYGAILNAVHVASSWGCTIAGPDAAQLAIEAAEREMEALMGNLVTSGRLDKIRFSHEILGRDARQVAQEICQSAQAMLANLVVVGTHRRQGMDRLLHGSVAQCVARNSAVPVLTVGPRAPKIWSDENWNSARPILYAASMHGIHSKSMDYACSLANDLHRELVLLHVDNAAAKGQQRPHTAAHGLLQAQTDTRIEQFAERTSHFDRPVRVQIQYGPVAETVLDVTSRIRPGVIVMGARSTAFPEWSVRTSDSITQHVQQEACCPVLTVRS